MNFSSVLPYRARILLIVLCVWLAAGFLLLPTDSLQLISVVPSSIHAPSVTREMFTPIHLRIPAINVDATVKPVGLTKKGAMDVPTNASDVGWFEPGPVAGQTGSVVLAGHLDTVFGTAGVFDQLHMLRSGDEIGVMTASGQTVMYVVRELQVYPYNNAPLQRIFGSTSGRYLHLITCNGTWNRFQYDKRLVVYAEFDRIDEKKVDNHR
jgi:sortase A